LNDEGVANKWVEIAGADHGFSKAGNWDLVMNETVAFFLTQISKRHLHIMLCRKRKIYESF
jgi:hypothetical protein